MAFLNPVFRIDNAKDSLGFVFSSTMENVDAVCEKITEYLVMKIDDIEPHLFAINLVIREGLTNAIRHGNANDPQTQVHLRLTIKKGLLLHVEIEDQGSGFDWKKQQEQILPDDEEHGRGIVIMESYFNRYSYNDKGNILYLEKDLSP